MKTTKRAFLIVLAVAMLLTSVIGTLSWLHDKDTEAPQVFALGDINIDLTYTALTSKATGMEVATDNVLVPNKTYTLDPTVTIKTDSEECYVRMFVKFNNFAAVKDLFRAETTLDKLFTAGTAGATTTFDSTNWEDQDAVLAKAFNADADGVFEFRYKTTVAKATSDTELAKAFSTFTLPYYFNNDDVAALVAANFSIEFEAQAIQVDYMTEYAGDTGTINEDDAWAAFDAMLATGSINNPNDTYGD